MLNAKNTEVLSFGTQLDFYYFNGVSAEINRKKKHKRTVIKAMQVRNKV